MEPSRRAPSWIVALLAAAAVTLFPWTFALSERLPSKHVATHWDVAWAGFDVALGLVLLATAVAAGRGLPWADRAATAAGTLLLCDAWFDLLTSSTTGELAVAAVLAGVAEVPLALLCFALALHRVPLRNVEAAGRAG